MAAPLLTVSVNNDVVAVVTPGETPCARAPSVQIASGSSVTFETSDGVRRVHALGDLEGFAHVSIRVQANLAVQPDAAITASAIYDAEDLPHGRGGGVRFQPFHLPEASDAPDLRGRGMFWRGLHYRGLITPGWVRLSCLCDDCGLSFALQSFHAGMMDYEYMYSDSGRHTLMIPPDAMPGDAWFDPSDPASVRALEDAAPPDPEGGRYRYRNPLRCPHCRAAYADFWKFPEMRPDEYYGHLHVGTPLEAWPTP